MRSARLVSGNLQGSFCRMAETDDAHEPKDNEHHRGSASGEGSQGLESCVNTSAASTITEPFPPYEDSSEDPVDGDLVATLTDYLAHLDIDDRERTISYPTEEYLDAEYGGRVERTHVSIEGLMRHYDHGSVFTRLARMGEADSTQGNGTYNKIFALTFTDETKMLARVKYKKTEATIEVMKSEIATIAFLRKHRPKIPVPETLYSDTSCKTPAGAPLMLMIRLPRVNAANDPVYGYVNRLQSDAAGDCKTTKLLRNITRLVAKLVRPLPVGGEALPDLKIGQLSVAKDDPKCIQGACDPETPLKIGPIVPHSSILMRDIARTLRTRALLLNHSTSTAHCSKKNDQKFVVSNSAINDTVADLTNIAAILSRQGRKRVLPLHPKHEELCLWHTDLGLWNILIDPETLDITGVIDWEGAMILPLVFAAETSFSLNPWPRATPTPPSLPQTSHMQRRALGSPNVLRTPEIEKPDAHVNSLNPEFYALVKDVDRAKLSESEQYTEEDVNEIELTWMRRQWWSMLAEEDPRFGTRSWEEHKRFLGVDVFETTSLVFEEASRVVDGVG
ncbi:MAG: hypothetical protein M1830_001748 [Pleopsidium flavum]|nr:MAG: hypothetical protein M1830_001748 [Pleopsidium flavum]